ncbi:hypothetical protein [Occallatibacter riparius]|uniref:Uncharacterized protein n=1 Tax=Occallatibacter riparius TaxID=1002689 RepID=A0A9J7BLC4_9BACT|nr:hypothetical protein [Occallatibacter riparius]UWZ83265.1 hypothetical protein MOP44_22180 [Occallatibacter riparius]
MKMLGLVLSVLLVAWVALAGFDQWVHARWWLVDGPDNQSKFFRTYDPQPVYAKYQHDGGLSVGHGQGCGPGFRSIQHFADFTPGFTIRVDRKQELLDALRNDILLQLRNTGTNVAATHDQADGGSRTSTLPATASARFQWSRQFTMRGSSGTPL